MSILEPVWNLITNFKHLLHVLPSALHGSSSTQIKGKIKRKLSTYTRLTSIEKTRQQNSCREWRKFISKMLLQYKWNKNQCKTEVCKNYYIKTWGNTFVYSSPKEMPDLALEQRIRLGRDRYVKSHPFNFVRLNKHFTPNVWG